MDPLDEAINELLERNPTASAQKISDAIIEHLESSLPDALRQMPVEATPLVQAKILEMMLRRMNSARKAMSKQKMSSQEQFARELYSMKFRLNIDDFSGTSVPIADAWRIASETLSPTELDGFSTDSTALNSVDQDRDSEKPSIGDQKLGTYSSRLATNPISKVRRFLLNEEITQRLGADTAYQSIAKTVEQAARKFAESSTLEWDFELLLESDIEIPSWKRLVLQISIPGADFEERIALWEQLDKSVRQKISELNSQDLLGGTVKLPSESLFLRMDMS